MSRPRARVIGLLRPIPVLILVLIQVLVLVLAPIAAPAAATEVKLFQEHSQTAFLAGTLAGVSVDPLGRLELATRAERVTAIDEPFLLSAAVLPDGWVVGTGNAGKVLKIDRKGKVSELFAAPEPEVFAVLADRDGTVFAGTSPHGKVYRIPPGGKAEVYFDPGETYIWALRRATDGALLVATGTQGKLFAVKGSGKGQAAGPVQSQAPSAVQSQAPSAVQSQAPSAVQSQAPSAVQSQLLYDSDDTHIRSLEVLPGGDLLVGTAGEGLVLRVSPDGKARTLYDAQQTEVVALASEPDGTCYAAVISSEASLVESAQSSILPPVEGAEGAGGQPAAGGGGGEPQPKVTVSLGPPESGGLRLRGKLLPPPSGPRSVLLRIDRDGRVDTLWEFGAETVYSLLWDDGALWVGTGLEGKLYRFVQGSMVLEKDVDERQVVALLADRPGPDFATTNAAALYHMSSGAESQGSFTSPALDALQVSRFGTLHWDGELPAGARLTFAFRSGTSAEPDATWSAWTPAKAGNELRLDDLPRARFLQWRADFGAGSSGSPVLYGVEISYLQGNLRPRIEELSALDPGQILVPANFNPSNQVYEPASPNRQGIFTSLEQASPDELRLKPLWKLGWRTLRWQAEDPNDDDLSYSLWFRKAETTDPWLKMTDDLEDSYYSFDATVLPDGIYRFKLVASDDPSNPPEEALAAELVSEPVVVDHTPPELVSVRREGAELRVALRDRWSPLREAVTSLDAGDWDPAPVDDGLLDGREEKLTLRPPAGTRLLLLRVTDAAFNVVTYDLSKDLR